MTAATAHLPPGLAGYLKSINPPEAEVLQRLRQTTAQHRMGKMHLAAEQAQLLAFLVQLIRAERCLTLLRPGGLIAIDNLLLGGRVYQENAEPAPESIERIRAFNQSLQTDSRVAALTLPLGDGLTLLRKRHSEETPCA